MNNKFTVGLKKYLSSDALEKLNNMKIGIAGAGGIGSNIACNLVRTGVRNLKIIDYDLVEDSNLNRQFFFADQIGLAKVEALKVNLLRINDSLTIDALSQKITHDNVRELFLDCHYVVEAFDTPADKTMLLNSFINSEKMIFSANGMAGYGGSENITVRNLGNNITIAGDFQRDIKNDPPLAPRVSLVAARISDLIIEKILISN